MQEAVPVPGNGLAEGRHNLSTGRYDGSAAGLRGDQAGVLVDIEHPEHVIGGRENHPGTVRQNHCLEHIHHLGDVGHLEPAGMLVENIQVDGGHHRIPHGVLLEQVAGVGTGLHIVPGAPFVQDEGNLPLRIIRVHNGDVVGQDFLDGIGVCKEVVVLFRGEIRGRFLVVPVRDGVVV